MHFLPRTSTSCATEQRWSTWEALTTMQHNHSHWAAPPTGQTSQERAKCPISATVHSLDSPWKRDPALLSDPPSSYRRGGGAGGSRGDKLKKKKKKGQALPTTTFSPPHLPTPPGNGLHLPQRSTLTHPTSHMRFLFVCLFWFKKWDENNLGIRQRLWQTRQPLYRRDDAERQLRLSAPSSQTSPIVKGYW